MKKKKKLRTLKRQTNLIVSPPDALDVHQLGKYEFLKLSILASSP